jgi:hypothetical protein
VNASASAAGAPETDGSWTTVSDVFANERYRLQELGVLPTRVPSPGSAAMVGRVASASAEIAVGKFLLVNPVSVLGAEAEGGAGVTLADTTTTVPVYLVGPGLPQTGDLLVCRFVDFRWVAERKGATAPGGNTIPGCPCVDIPASLYMHVATQPVAGFVSFVFPSALQWMAKPAELAIYRSDAFGYYGTTDVWSSDNTSKFRYWFSCSGGIYFVSGLLTPDSPFGYPGQFLIMSWLAGLPGNTCSPFRLTNGSTTSSVYRVQGISIDTGGPS